MDTKSVRKKKKNLTHRDDTPLGTEFPEQRNEPDRGDDKRGPLEEENEGGIVIDEEK